MAVQSVPADIIQPGYPFKDTFHAWLEMINSAQHTVDIACYYMTLLDGLDFPREQGGAAGVEIYKALLAAAQSRGVAIRIVQQLPTARMPAYDTGNLSALGVAKVRSIDFAKVNGLANLPGSRGILHTKFIVVDSKHAYIGSANLGTFAL